MANFLIGCLNKSAPGKYYLIACKQLDKVNHVTMVRFINDTFMNFFLPEIVPTNKILLMVSNAASYMVKAGQQLLKVLYPNLVHVTCLAHGLNRVVEEIRNSFPTVNSLISNVKKIFLKSPLRIQIYKEKLPINTHLSPEPIITRWLTWLNAACFYAEHSLPIKELIILSFEETNIGAISKCKSILENRSLHNELCFIKLLL
uniref:Uncharacterized protein LOC114334130 n=1 Tax=Diabrotica virgifera virgifera TaxID=50390 RepID=A0A6P7FYT2_DIAVI